MEENKQIDTKKIILAPTAVRMHCFEGTKERVKEESSGSAI